MSESDGEIEYLEEDEEIVQQCVQITQEPVNPGIVLQSTQNNVPLLIERRLKRKRKAEDDSDYDPSDDGNVLSPPSPPEIRKRKPPVKHSRTNQGSINDEGPSTIKKTRESSINLFKDRLMGRKKMNIRIPDYDDPLCLPVRAIKVNESDKKRLNNWNNVCLEHFKNCDTMLKPERGDTKSSVRTAIFKKVTSKQTGGEETTIWCKTSVENEDGDKKSEIFQCTLPRYKEKKVLNKYSLMPKRTRPTRVTEDVILSKEEHTDGEALIVYKPKESLAAVYGLIEKRESSETQCADNDSKMYLKELTCTKMCSPCFQTSWRGPRKGNQKALSCPVCGRTYVTIYNMLSHFKTHSASEITRYKKFISAMLAGMLAYHYKCRICRSKFDSIRALRVHVKEHQSNSVFKCEIGNHLVNA